VEIVIGLVLVGLAIAGVVRARKESRDEVFAGLTPGLLPAPGQPVERRMLGRGEEPPIAVRFEPPVGLRPAPAGVIIDSSIDAVELSATLIDLAIRGWLVLKPILPSGATPGATKPTGWELHQVGQAPAELLTATEQAVLAAAFAHGPVSTVAELRAGHGLREAAQRLGEETAARGWFRPPSAGWLRSAGWLAAALGLATWLSGFAVVGLGAIAAGGVAVLGASRLGQPVTAEGYAARTQALGFRQYLATAEADQLRFEVGVDVFGRYLPYAMVFGVVDHWRTVFADALRADLDAGAEFAGFGWLALDNALTGLILVDLLTADAGLFDNLGEGFGGELGTDASGLSDGTDASDGDFGGDAGDGSGGDFGGGGDGGGWGGFDGGGFDGGGFD